MKNWILVTFLCVFSACLCGACSEDTDAIPYLEIEEETMDCKSEASNKELAVQTNVSDWTARSDKDWCRVSVKEKSLMVSVDESDERSVREAVVTIQAGKLSKALNVRQLGYEAAILISTQIMNVDVMGGELSFSVTANVEISYELPAWITAKTRTRAPEMVTSVHEFVAGPSEEEKERIGNIKITEVPAGPLHDKNKLATATVLVKQKGLGAYAGGDGEDIKGDLKIKIAGGVASSYQQGEGIELSFDDNPATIYHSKWDNSAPNYFPITLSYTFEDVSDVDYLVYSPRTDGSNGHFKQTEIFFSEDGTTFTKLMDHDFQGSSIASKVLFDRSVKARAIRLVVKGGAGDGQGFASCSEMEFYKRNLDTFDYSTLFTDETCSELKAGMTETEITRCEYPFFKNIAYYMLKQKYPVEFRIGRFKAYPYPDIQAGELKTSPYSQLDNPTGISVKGGDNLIVFVGDTYGYTIGLRVQNLDKPEGDGFGGNTYALSRGINKISMKEKGLAYVMYHIGQKEDPHAKPVKIHFASGTVNGYFDSERHGRERWTELIGKATDKHFDVVGKYAHLTFETNNFRTHTRNGKDLIAIYDAIVYNEQAFMGLEKYNRMWKNRMYFSVMYHSYMYAAGYHTGYHVDTMAELCNENALSTSACWGPAHEVGHVNQTAPGLKWRGTIEVTNNIMSQYIQTTVLEQNSRVQTEDLSGESYRNRYTKAWSSIIATGSPHSRFQSQGDASGQYSSDVFCKLIPFWQLELYFGRVLGRTPRMQSDKGGFYPDVYEHIRTHPDLRTPGEQQLEFVYICSKASGYNLLDFFTKWGFLTPVRHTIDDYGQEEMNITGEQVDRIKKRVEDLALPKPDIALEYISDNTWELYKTKPSVVTGTTSRNGKTLTMTGWRNVAVYEVRNADGQLIFISDGLLSPAGTASFTLTSDWNNSYKVYAVAVDGKKTEVKLN